MLPNTPSVSVVMGVYNGAELLSDTIDSVLSQEFSDFEFIIVNDGSTDNTRAMLEKFAPSDQRIRLIHKDNEGLTPALIDGCSIARGKYIARHDAGDVSLPVRLVKQVDRLEMRKDITMISCGTRFVGPEDETLYEVTQSESEAILGFKDLTMSTIRGPSHHGSTMFRRKDYLSVGGYRRNFQVAQDIDLWTRLVEIGQPTAIQEILYIAKFSPNGISTWKREQQLQTMAVILECARARREGESEQNILSKLPNSLTSKTDKKKNIVDSGYYCFIGSCLKSKQPDKARIYFKKALQNNPLNYRALYHWLTT